MEIASFSKFLFASLAYEPIMPVFPQTVIGLKYQVLSIRSSFNKRVIVLLEIREDDSL